MRKRLAGQRRTLAYAMSALATAIYWDTIIEEVNLGLRGMEKHGLKGYQDET
jgi:hypothetical protein